MSARPTPSTHPLPGDGPTPWPVFSVAERGDDIVAETPVPVPDHLPREILGWATTAALLWPLALMPLLSQLLGAGHVPWWWALPCVLLVFLAAVVTEITYDAAHRIYGQRATALRIAEVPALAGCAAAGVGTSALLLGPWPPADGAPFDVVLGALPGALGALCLLLAGVSALRARRRLRYVRTRQRTIRALREWGRSEPGVLTAVEFHREWSGGNPRFAATVEVPGAQPSRTIRAHLVTTPDQVPRLGSAVLVTTDPSDPAVVLVDLPAEPPPRFEADGGRYRQPSN
ncbi:MULTISPECIES: hypothetical protein [Actinoalloteichus]|uniref:Uncharacterized protein n=2 Tax=Actinoalloteichus cyanogriseus TaxID=2893586 RepID=A0ABT1JIX7_ACTCY|nr:hypothetical protein [Actinoalloteichus caeruleus]MCP2332174.1 hypothetical protein [Actinoalloteichus caeruleus DSM 43889]